MNRMILICGLLSALALCACSTGSSDDSTKIVIDQPETANGTSNQNTTQNTSTLSKAEPVTMANIVGSWSETMTGGDESDTYTKEIITTYSSDGTYVAVSTDHYTSKDDPSKTWIIGSAEKGTFSIAGDIVTWKRTHTFINVSGSVDITKSIEWKEKTNTLTGTIAIIDGYLCNAYKREGTGSGIIGTWTSTESQVDGTHPKSYTKNVLCFTSSELTTSQYEDETGVFTSAPDIKTYTYTIDKNNVLTTNNLTETSSTPIFLASDWLCLGLYATKQ